MQMQCSYIYGSRYEKDASLRRCLFAGRVCINKRGRLPDVQGEGGGEMIDPNEAPEGFVAVETTGCKGCAFLCDPRCQGAPCLPEMRKDGEQVQFRWAGNKGSKP